ncbi:FecCD family ABC transporter permease [Alkalibacterium pelagium]|uniref:Iron complex transport system permease protein n=1 Tax=Alkalibacterium pelagium TaxID=426702 RepID=A0A1H7NY43_9LACT|nr:iron ABC transporter permease [Alkalibacterium pelagium]GEN51465.1 iron(3+)-hydroxamate import system permease protein FhuB [Alkalibacterium pelagium]SEL28530.1 iron complex transport system permease protein [Alkalibacterium pelagium]
MEQIRKDQLTKKDTQKRLMKRLSAPHPAALILILSIGALILIMTASISIGVSDIGWRDILESFTAFDSSSTSHVIIRDLRIPRILAAALVGAFLAVSGVIMQALTLNPLASPSIMGVTSGSAFMIAVAFAFHPQSSYWQLILWSFAGAGLGTGMVFLIGSFSKRGLTPVKLALAGAAVSALLQSLSTIIAIHFNVARDISFWFAGGVAGVRMESVRLIGILAFAGLIVAFALSRSLTIMGLGEEMAKGLGIRIGWIKFISVLVVLILTGAAVSIAGTVGFIGLVIPHIAKKVMGMNYRWVIPGSAVFGAGLLVLADMAARTINPPYETPVGALTALIGVPFFLFLARKEGRG